MWHCRQHAYTKFSTECCKLLQQYSYQDKSLAKLTLRKVLETIRSMLFLPKPTLFSSIAFNHGKIQHKLHTGLRISKSFPGGSRSRDVQHCQVGCMHVYRRYFSIIIFHSGTFQRQKVPICVLKPVKNNLFALSLNSCNKISSYWLNWKPDCRHYQTFLTHLFSFKNK